MYNRDTSVLFFLVKVIWQFITGLSVASIMSDILRWSMYTGYGQRSYKGQDAALAGFWLHTQRYCHVLVALSKLQYGQLLIGNSGFILKIFWINLLNPEVKSNYFKI